jgi:hypothetical protein
MSSLKVFEYAGAPTQQMMFESARAIDGMRASMSKSRSPLAPHVLNLAESTLTPVGQELFKSKFAPMQDRLNAKAKAFRDNTRAAKFPTMGEAIKARGGSGALMKADLDVGTLTNFSQITGGQSLGYVSLDVRMARGTVRPSSFTLYQALNKTAAYQVVDYWAYASATGGPLPAGAFADYSSVSQGALSTSAGQYELKSITLKMALNGRAITTALAAQNSFVNIEEQENTNAALTVLESVNWANYWGNPAIYPNMYQGIAKSLPLENIFNFQEFSTSNASKGWSNEQTLFNMIYEVAGAVTKFRTYGQITHAFMSPGAISDLQGLVTTQLMNVANDITRFQSGLDGIIVNGDLQGMKTRFGNIQFPIDIFITARDKPAQSVTYNESGTSPATSVNPSPAASVAVTTLAAGSSGASGSQWTTAYAASSGVYIYAVASADSSMNESTLTYSAPVSGIVAGGAYSVAITPPTANDMTAFRVFRSGLGYSASTPNPSSFRYIGDVVGNGTAVVTFVDLNAHIPGSDTLFLLDLDDDDQAIDFRYLLPLTKIELFAQSLYMPWAVAMIGAIRVKIPKFHALINNYVPTTPDWNPLSANA